VLTDLQHSKEILPLIGGLAKWVRTLALVVLRSCPSPEDFVNKAILTKGLRCLPLSGGLCHVTKGLKDLPLVGGLCLMQLTLTMKGLKDLPLVKGHCLMQ
jgi:hypothetical protein